jgi:hypothetical protein
MKFGLATWIQRHIAAIFKGTVLPHEKGPAQEELRRATLLDQPREEVGISS